MKQRKMYRESIVMRRKLELKLTVWTRRKKETSNQKRKATRIQKNEGRLRNLQDKKMSLNVPTSEL